MFYSLPQNYSTSARNIFREAFIIFKLFKLSVNLRTLCFLSYKKNTYTLYPLGHDTLKIVLTSSFLRPKSTRALEKERTKNYFLAVNLFHSRTPMEDHKFTTQFSDFFIEENENLLSSKTIFTKSSFSASRTPHILNFTTEHILYCNTGFFLLKRDGPRFATRLPHIIIPWRDKDFLHAHVHTKSGVFKMTLFIRP